MASPVFCPQPPFSSLPLPLLSLLCAHLHPSLQLHADGSIFITVTFISLPNTRSIFILICWRYLLVWSTNTKNSTVPNGAPEVHSSLLLSTLVWLVDHHLPSCSNLSLQAPTWVPQSSGLHPLPCSVPRRLWAPAPPAPPASGSTLPRNWSPWPTLSCNPSWFNSRGFLTHSQPCPGG